MTRYPQNPLFQKCLAYLASLPHLQATIQAEPYFSSEVLADGNLILTTNHKSVNYVCEIKTDITPDVIEPVVEYFANLAQRLKQEQRPLLVTSNLSNLVMEELLDRNVEFIDVDGNVYLNSPELYLIVRNQMGKETTDKSLEITAADLQVMYALLTQQRLVTTFSDIFDFFTGNRTSRITPTIAHNSLNELEKLGYINFNFSDTGYQIIDYLKLLERWELGYAERLRAKLFLGKFSPTKTKQFFEIEEQLKESASEYGYLIGGELGAALITNYLRPFSATLHVGQNTNYRQIVVDLKMKPDSEGNITLLRNFSPDEYFRYDFGDVGKNLVHPLLIHAELVRTGNSRLTEAANLIYDRYIEELAEMHDSL